MTVMVLCSCKTEGHFKKERWFALSEKEQTESFHEAFFFFLLFLSGNEKEAALVGAIHITLPPLLGLLSN